MANIRHPWLTEPSLRIDQPTIIIVSILGSRYARDDVRTNILADTYLYHLARWLRSIGACYVNNLECFDRVPSANYGEHLYLYMADGGGHIA